MVIKTGISLGGLETHVTLTGHTRIDFRGSRLRKSMRKAGAVVVKESRRRISRRAISAPGEYPGRDSGEMRRSLAAKVSRSGFLVRIQHNKTAAMEAFYPAFLHYGVTGKPARKDHHAQVKDGKWRVRARGNYIIDAMQSKEPSVRVIVRDGLVDSLVPRK